MSLFGEEATQLPIETIKQTISSNNQLLEKYYDEANNQITEIKKTIVEEKKDENIGKSYNVISGIWRKISESPPLNNPLIENSFALLKKAQNDKNDLVYAKQMATVFDEQKIFFEKIQKRHYHSLLLASQVRSSVIMEGINKGHYFEFIFDSYFFHDIYKELILAPNYALAWFYLKYLKITSQMKQGGLVTFLYVIKHIFFLGLMFFFPILVLFFYQKNKFRVDNIRQYFFRKRFQLKFYGKVALWIKRVSPYIPWLMMIGMVPILRIFISKTDINELTYFLPYFEFYFFYRIFKIFITVDIASTLYKLSSFNALETNELENSAKSIGLFFLLSYGCLYLIKDLVGQALCYHLIFYFVLTFGLVFLYVQIGRWKTIFFELGIDLYPSFKDRINQFINTPIAPILSLIFLIFHFLQIFNDFLYGLIKNFEITKAISAKILKKKLQTSTDSKSQEFSKIIPQTYINFFNTSITDDLIISPHNKLLVNIKEKINEWIKDPSEEPSLAIYGIRGSGKTTILSLLAKEYTDLEIIRMSPTESLTRPREIKEFLEKGLQISLENGVNDLVEADKARKKSLVIIDNIHNFYLMSEDGMKGLSYFFDLINAQTQNIFWVCSINEYSWNFLNCVFKKNQFFRHVMKIPRFSDRDIREMILNRHQKTNYNLIYDDLILAATSGDSGNIGATDSQFFTLLWEISKGVPEVALKMWINCLRPSSYQTLKVGLPEEMDLKRDLPYLSDDACFVYASLLRHGGLSISDAINTTNIADGIVKQSIKMGLEKKFLEKIQNKYRVSISAQSKLASYLIGKNFIYE